ncbi:MAG TPA: hydrolase [Sphingobium sp.]|uniref:hydrolase n=1 Tax=Sphingobium sp. TaxID=1912891 RepID=UPI002ED2B2F8
MTGLSTREARIVTHLRTRQRDMVQAVTSWSSINSGSRNLAGLAVMRNLIVERLMPLEGSIAVHQPDPVTSFDATGAELPLAHGSNIHVCKRPGAPRRVLLTGHMDTVFAADHAFQTPRMVDDATLVGPGVADMKGGILVLLEALMALEEAGAISDIGWDIVINADEEVSSAGSRSLLKNVARTAQVGLTFEPSLTPEGLLAGARKGSGNFIARITGRAAHAGRDPLSGRNAVVAASDLAIRLQTLASPTLSVNVARLQGGGENNVVPDLALLWWNMRPLDIAAQHQAEQAMTGIRAAIAAEHEVGVEMTGGFARPPKPMDPRTEALFAFVRDTGHDLGLALGWQDTGGVCDGNNIAAEGVAVIDTMGVRGGAIHTDREFLILDSLSERASLTALTLMRLAEGQLDERIGW